ncbi:hypothetical protein FB645_006161 [Coemansia sp. IMI 203386]|nr:hypothetical protein FB645_006161 [Coemansia sp. IMI 203386]
MSSHPTSKETLLAEANNLYTQAVHEVPPNRTTLDNLVNYLRRNPSLYYSPLFTTAYDAAQTILGILQDNDDGHVDDSLQILTPPAVWGWAVMEDSVCYRPPVHLRQSEYPQLVDKFINLAMLTLNNIDITPGQVVRRGVQALTRFWPILVDVVIAESPDNVVWKRHFENMLTLAKRIVALSRHSDDPSMQVHLTKFLEVEAIIFSPLPRPGLDSRGIVDLSKIPESHPYINKTELGRRGESARVELVHLLPNSDNLHLCNISFITGIVSSIIYLMNMRPQFCPQLLEKLTEWYAIINSSGQTLTHSQLVIIGKTLRIMLLHLYTRKHMSGYAEELESTLDRIGGPDWAAWQERQAREKERRERQRIKDRENLARQQQQQQQQQQGNRQGRWPAGKEAGHGPGGQRSMSTTGSGARQHKRISRFAEDEDEEYQSRMLEENAKRVKLDKAEDGTLVTALPTAEGANALGLQQTANATSVAVNENDKEMEAEVRKAINTGPFELQLTQQLSAEERELLIVDAMKRIVASSKAIQNFIASNRVHSQGGASAGLARNPDPLKPRALETTELGAQPSLSNGLSTNAGVLEDCILLLVRMISNCYMMSFNPASQVSSTEDAGPSSRWAEMHACIDGVLEEIKMSIRSSYGLAILLLYEIWLAVTGTDPHLEHIKSETANKYSIHALYSRWCGQIFDAVIQCSIEAMQAHSQAQVVPDMASGTAAAVPPVPSAPVIDRLALDFILDVPYLSDAHFQKLEHCLKSPATAALGFWTIEKAMDMRPPLFKAGINSLLAFSVSYDRTTRIGCIRAAKKYFTTSSDSGLIEKFAQTSFKHGVQNAEETTVKTKEAITKIRSLEPAMGPEAVAQREAELAKLKLKGDTDIDMELATHGEILLALCTRKMDLLSVVFDAYVSSSVPVRLGFVRLIGPLVKSVSGTPTRILPVLAKFPAGAETLAIKVIKVLAVESAAVLSKDLVQGILQIQAERNLDPRFVVAISIGLKKTEALEWIGKVTGLLDGQEQPKAIVRDFFLQLTTSFPGRPSVLSPTELLVALHNNLGTDATDSQAIEAISIYESMVKENGTRLFSSEVFNAALNQLVSQENIPPLMLRTAEIQYKKRNGSVGPIISLLIKLKEKEFWKLGEPMVREVAHTLLEFQPGTLSLVKSLPKLTLKKIVAFEPNLSQIIYKYVIKMSHKDQDHFRWLIKAVEKGV